MSWVKLDDSMPDDGKIVNLSDPAFRAYVTAICYSARMLTNGHLPVRKANEFAGRKAKAVVSELAPGIWHEPGIVCPSPDCNEEAERGEYVIHNYLKYNPTREKVLAERQALSKARSNAGSKGAASRWQNDGPVPVPTPVPNSFESTEKRKEKRKERTVGA